MDKRIPLRVLIVEDSQDDALLLVHELTRGGFDAVYERVEDAEAMYTALKEKEWDIVVTDHNMPDFDSTRALKLAQEISIDTPVIMVSGTIGEEKAVEAMKNGAHDYIMKNNLTRLVPAVKRELLEAEKKKDFRKAESTIRYLALHDSLTGLVNRHEFEKRLSRAIENSKIGIDTHTLLYIDLDQFKLVNDTCGHVAGDELLRCLAVSLRVKIRTRDTLARLGGDEFGVLLERCPLQRGRHIAESLRQIIRDFHFVWKGKSFSVGASFGVVAIDSTSTNMDELLRAADMSCYAAKEFGRNRIHIYREDDIELSKRHNEMEWVSSIKQALENDSFQLYEHKIVALDGGNSGVWGEFLLRMVDSSGREIMPDVFIPAAERYNIMPDVDRWVIKNGFQILAERNKKVSGNAEHPQMSFINLSATSLSDQGCPQFIYQQLLDYDLKPEMICFEITETAAITDFRNAVEFIEGIKQVGCRVALDDFGTGMSSFSYLKRLPVDFLKIDGSFVKNMLDNPIDCSIVEAINNIGHVAGIKTIAEFVEDEEIHSKLQTINIDYAQGYFIDTPQPVFLE